MTSLRSVVNLLSIPLFGCVKIIPISFYIWLTSMTIICRWTRTYLKRFLEPLSLMLFGNYLKKKSSSTQPFCIFWHVLCQIKNGRKWKLQCCDIEEWSSRLGVGISAVPLSSTTGLVISITHRWKKNCRSKAESTCALIFLSSWLDL